jgi:uncharacterized protein DUF4347/uncharacterized protein DUF4214/hemolysin type calcium-binding protein
MIYAKTPIATNSKILESKVKRKEIAFIDPGIDDYQTLVDGVNAGIEIHLLDSKQDGVLQITNMLQQRAGLDAIHIISHGNVGYLSLGNSVLSTSTLSKYQHALFSWQAGFKQNADILIYGCEVAKGTNGRAFIDDLANITGANIAASNNLTGNPAFGGDWKLGVSTGDIFSTFVFCEEKLKHFSSTLATNTLDFTTDTVAAFVTATHPTNDFGTINFKIVKDANSTGTANASLTLATTGQVNDADNDFYYTGTDGEYLVIFTDGREVDFQSVKLGSIGATIYTDITGYAYQDGSLLGSQTINPVGANFPNDNVSITPETVTFTNAIFENADEIRLIGTNNFGDDVGQLLIDDLILADAIPPNTTPAISINNANLAYTENAVATQIDAAATLTDADGDADWDGGTLVVQITGNNEVTDQLSIVDNVVGNINTSGTNLLDNATVIGTLSASEGMVTNGTALTITFNANATNALVQQVARAIHYSNTSNDPGTSNRTITFTATDTNAAGANDTRTVAVTAVNDEPTLTATGSNPTFTEDGSAASLFSGAAVSTIESGQTLTGLTLTVTNVNDGSNERLNTDGTAIVLTNGTSGTTATNSLSYSVSVTGTTATVTLSGGTVSTAAAQTLVNAISYQNNSNDPNTSNRVVTITSVTDSGSNTGSNDNVAALAVASTVTMTALNDEPTLTATGSNPTFTEGGSAASLFSGAAVSTIESGQTLTGFTLTVTNLADGSNEILNADGTAIALTNANSGTTATNNLSYSVSVTGSTATATFSGGTVSNAAMQTLVNAISYQNNSADPGTSNRVITLTSLTDSGSNTGSNDNVAALATASTVTVTALNDEPTLTATGSNPTFTEGGSAASLFSGTAASTVESGQTLTGLTLTVTNVNDGSNERLNADGTAIVLTNGTSGTTATNSLSYSVSVTGTTATVTLSGGTVSTAAAQTLLDAISYQNNSNDPNISNRVVTITSLTDSGSNTGANDNVAALAIASTVTMTALNDEPTLTATGSNPTFTEGGAAASLFSGTAASTVESGQTLTGLTLTVTNVNDGSNERLNADGTAIVLTNGTSGTTATNSLSYSVSVTGTTATVTLSGGTVSTAATQTLINAISYQNNSNDPNTSSRVVTITSLTDSGSNTGANDNVAALAVSSTVTVAANPAITSATYDYNTNQLVVTGTNFVAQAGATNDVDVSLLTITGEGGVSYTLTSAIDVEIDSATQFTTILSGADIYNVEALLNKNGTASDDATTFNLAAADNWMTGTSVTPDISDATGNGITISNVVAPAVTSATYDVSTGVLVITGTNFVNKSGAANDLDASLLTFTGEANATYTLTDTSDVDITSATSATVTLSSTDRLNIQGLLNKAGTISGDATTYNLAVADNWLPGAPASTNIADLTGNGVTVSNIQTPTVTSATYDSDTGVLVVTGTNLFKKTGATNDIDISTLTLTGGTANATYTITSVSDVEITSATSFSVTLAGADKTNVDALLDQIGTTSSGGSTYNLAAADNWLAGADGATNIADPANAVTVSINPKITSATYNAGTGALVVTGTNIQANGGGLDIDASTLTFTGEGGTTYTLTDSADVERDSVTQFTVNLSATDKAALNQIINKDGTVSTSATTYNLAAADDWNTNVTVGDTADTTGNAITASNVAAPTITSSTYNASTGVLVVTGTGFLRNNGASNDIDASLFTFTGEGGDTYKLTDSADVEITSGTAFTITLSATDKAALNQIINKDGTTSTGGTTYNLAAAEDWATGADAAVNVVDATGNAITVSNVAVPAITSSTYHTGTGLLVVTGTGFLKSNGAANDIDASLFTFTGEGGVTYTLTDSADVEITSNTAFTITLSATDKTAVNLLLNKNGAASSDATTYNLAAAENWAVGADAAVNVVDAAGNGITVTIPAPSSGGGGGSDTTTPPPTTTDTIDGADTSTTTEEDGSTTTTVAVVEDSREDDPATLSADHADIPILTDADGEPILIVSLPTGVGLNVNGQSAALSTQDAVHDLIARIEQKTDVDSSQRLEMTVHSQDFIALLAISDTVAVQTITPTVPGGQAPNVPIIITAADDSVSGSKQALVIDASNLPSGTILQLDNVSFAAIVGAVRVVGGAGQNFATGDHQNQFIVLGADDDRLFGGGGDDTVGSLGGNDLTFGDAGNDIVYGGSANDVISGGIGNDQLNGGFGFDVALQDGQQIDYQIDVDGKQIVLTHTNGTIDTITDAEFIRFDSGPGLAIAYSAAEAAAHHLVQTWLERDLTADEGSAVQNWQGADATDIAHAFLELPETAAFQDKTTDELLAGLDENPNIIQFDVTREIIAGDGDDQGYLPLGLALNADGNAGYDVLRMQKSRSDVHLETAGDRLEVTRLEDGAMLSLINAEAIAFDSGETVILTHNAVEGTIARLVHTLLNRGATVEEWQAGRQALADNVEMQAFFNWFQDRTDFDQLSDGEYIQTLFQNTLQRTATEDEVDGYLSQLNDGSLNRDWVAFDIAQSEEAITVIGSVIDFDGGV